MVARTATGSMTGVLQYDKQDSKSDMKNGKSQSGGKGGSKLKVMSRNNLHFLRKFFHLAAGAIFAGLYEFVLSREQALRGFGLLFVFLAIGEYARVRFVEHWLSKLTFRAMSLVARNYEATRLSGMVFFVAGVLTCIMLFPRNVAILSILYLSFGDPFASTCGIRFGYLGPKFSNGKSLVGSLGGLFACAFTTTVYYLSHGFPLNGSLLLVSLLGGIAGAIPETFCGRIHDGTGGPIDVDDNIAVPVGSGLIFFLFLQLFPIYL
mmetsp:Transcript_14065/g.32425  ORF Transcript_14065/g.32425 Transcript_14065/m.32425 type:complete len:264 (-) Transcript_14065:89-880(-)